MGGYWKPYQKAIDDFFEWLFADKKKRKILKYLPKNCQCCELLGICRNEENDWKCKKGCLILNQEKDYSSPNILNKQRLTRKQKKLPVKRVVIAGCRTFNDYEEAKQYIEHCISNIRQGNRIVIVSGGSRGADKLGEQFAIENNYEIERYYADWDNFGRSAGPRRNEVMVKKSDYVICFWNGQSRGTESMIKYAKIYDRPLRIKYIK